MSVELSRAISPLNVFNDCRSKNAGITDDTRRKMESQLARSYGLYEDQ